MEFSISSRVVSERPPSPSIYLRELQDLEKQCKKNTDNEVERNSQHFKEQIETLNTAAECYLKLIDQVQGCKNYLKVFFDTISQKEQDVIDLELQQSMQPGSAQNNYQENIDNEQNSIKRLTDLKSQAQEKGRQYVDALRKASSLVTQQVGELAKWVESHRDKFTPYIPEEHYLCSDNFKNFLPASLRELLEPSEGTQLTESTTPEGVLIPSSPNPDYAFSQTGQSIIFDSKTVNHHGIYSPEQGTPVPAPTDSNRAHTGVLESTGSSQNPVDGIINAIKDKVLSESLEGYTTVINKAIEKYGVLNATQFSKFMGQLLNLPTHLTSNLYSRLIKRIFDKVLSDNIDSQVTENHSYKSLYDAIIAAYNSGHDVDETRPITHTLFSQEKNKLNFKELIDGFLYIKEQSQNDTTKKYNPYQLLNYFKWETTRLEQASYLADSSQQLESEVLTSVRTMEDPIVIQDQSQRRFSPPPESTVIYSQSSASVSIYNDHKPYTIPYQGYSEYQYFYENGMNSVNFDHFSSSGIPIPQFFYYSIGNNTGANSTDTFTNLSETPEASSIVASYPVWQDSNFSDNSKQLGTHSTTPEADTSRGPIDQLPQSDWLNPNSASDQDHFFAVTRNEWNEWDNESEDDSAERPRNNEFEEPNSPALGQAVPFSYDQEYRMNSDDPSGSNQTPKMPLTWVIEDPSGKRGQTGGISSGVCEVSNEPNGDRQMNKICLRFNPPQGPTSIYEKYPELPIEVQQRIIEQGNQEAQDAYLKLSAIEKHSFSLTETHRYTPEANRLYQRYMVSESTKRANIKWKALPLAEQKKTTRIKFISKESSARIEANKEARAEWTRLNLQENEKELEQVIAGLDEPRAERRAAQRKRGPYNKGIDLSTSDAGSSKKKKRPRPDSANRSTPRPLRPNPS